MPSKDKEASLLREAPHHKESRELRQSMTVKQYESGFMSYDGSHFLIYVDLSQPLYHADADPEMKLNPRRCERAASVCGTTLGDLQEMYVNAEISCTLERPYTHRKR